MTKSLFSESELKILKIIGRKKITIIEITYHFYEGRPRKGTNNNIAVLIRRIKSKCKQHELPWTLNGEGGGRAGRKIWRGYV